jgi:hypothetical protein
MGEFEFFPKGVLCTLSEEGDTKVIWDPENEDEVEAAEAQFDRLIEKGFTAFSVDKKGEKKKQIRKFDREAGKIIMVPIMQGG